MPVLVYTVKRHGRGFIGDAIAEKLNALEEETGVESVVVAEIPRIVRYFDAGAFEVVEVDLIIKANS